MHPEALPLNPERLRIAIVPTSPGAAFPPRPSDSIARVMEFLIRGLQELGHAVTLFAAENSQVPCECVPICPTPIFLEQDPGLDATRRFQERALCELERHADRLDIVHAHSLDIPNYFHSTHFVSELFIPNVTTLHSCIEVSNYRYFTTCRNPIISVSENQRRACPDLTFVATVYHGLDPDPFQIVESPQDYLCFLGRLDETKQPHLAMCLAIQRETRLKIAGPISSSGPGSYFDRLCRPLLNHPLIDYLGELDMAAKIELLGNARCNLHPTGFREPFGLTVLEAAYCGTPTMAIRRGALPELIEDNVTGILVEDFAEGCHELDRCFKLDRGLIARRSRERFHYRFMCADYVRAYRSAIDHYHSGVSFPRMS